MKAGPDLLLAWAPAFWREIDARTRRARTDAVSLADVRRDAARPARARRAAR